MSQDSVTYEQNRVVVAPLRYVYLLRPFFAGLLLPFGFAPFHLPGFAILGLALFFAQLKFQPLKQSFLIGFTFGLGFLGLGVSWVYVSIHDYGHLNTLSAALITLGFVFYLSLFPALVAVVYNKLAKKCTLLLSCFLFSAIWCLGEWLRSVFLGGFPWLLLGFGQIDTPLKHLFPLIGVYGVSFFTCLAAAFLVMATQVRQRQRYLWLIAFISVVLAPSILKYKAWTTMGEKPISVGIIQANLSMRDKWDESLFWQLVQQYKDKVETLIGKKKLIVMPESAIPIPASYVNDFLDTIDFKAKQAKSSILLGIPQSTGEEETYYNTITALGAAKGNYIKQHIVPFGEYIPQPFMRIINWLEIPVTNLKPGMSHQKLIRVHKHPIATLICYELAYPQLLRKQLPKAEWIVSVSDDGWFGRSLAMYQHLQMARVFSILTGRFHVVANNDGLSSVINPQGSIIASLPAFSSGILEADVYPAIGMSPWTYWGDAPMLLICILIALFAFYKQKESVLRNNATI